MYLLMEDHKIYECPKCQIRKHYNINAKIDFTCKCCGGKMKYITTVRRNEMEKLKKENYYKNNKISVSKDIPKCPTCGSTNIKKISTMERAVSVGTLGLFSKKINKSFKCGNCGYTW